MKPYWQSEDGAIKVYNARCEDVIASVLPVREVALIHADPPYGNGDDTRRPDRKEGAAVITRSQSRKAFARAWAPIVANYVPFDPAPLLALNRPTVLWGANHYSNRVPGSPSWLFWDKREDAAPDNNADGELAWTNLGGALRTFRHVWRGLARASEGGTPHLHPTQKPIALSAYVFQRAKLKRGDLVFSPYGGSGPDLPAAQAMGLRLIWCEIEREYCDTAIGRLGAITQERAAEPVGPLFGGPRDRPHP